MRRKRGAAEGSQVDLNNLMLAHAKVPGHARRGLEFDLVPLAVIEGERVALETLPAGDSQAGGGIQSSAQ